MQDLKIKDFDKIFSMLTDNFTDDEHRNYDRQKELLSNELYKIKVTRENEEIKAFVAFWTFQKFIYIEHLAVDKSCQGTGIGTEILKELLDNTDKIIVLEVQPPKDANSKRRIKFYKTNGFHYNDYEYLQPAYSKDKNDIELKILSSTRKINDEEFSEVVNYLYKYVYNQKEKEN